MDAGRSEKKSVEVFAPIGPSNVIRLSEAASFTIEDIPGKSDEKKVSFFYSDPDPQKHSHLMLVIFPPDEEPKEIPMIYDKSKQGWAVEIERSNNAGEMFLITTAETPGKKENQRAERLQRGFISLKNGIVQPVNKIFGDPSGGKIETFLLTASGQILKPEIIDENKLSKGERYIEIYTPPGYDSSRKPPYDFQITLDGWQYINILQMNVVFDHLAARDGITPPVTVFISPHSGPPDEKKEGFTPVVPRGYSLAERLKEYCCNATFAETLASIPTALKEKFNITADPKHRTIWGVSAGGLQATYTALLHPDIFGNVVAQSPMAWNIPVQNIIPGSTSLPNGGHWRQKIIDKKDEKGNDITWSTSTALLPEAEGIHKEYLTQIVRNGQDEITGKPIDPRLLRFYFDAGEKEREYHSKDGSANLVKATQLLAEVLEEKGATVIDHEVHMLAGGHHNMTWMRNISDISKTIHHIPSVEIDEKKRSSLTATAQAAKLLGVSPSALTSTVQSLENEPEEKKDLARLTIHNKKNKDFGITDEEMARSTFGQGSNTAKKLKR